MQNRPELPRTYLPGPAHVSPPAAPAPAGAPANNMGPTFGIQRYTKWAPGDSTPKQIVDATRADALWRLSVHGAVFVTVLYGTTRAREIQRLQAPVVITIPGQFLAVASPIDVDAGAEATVALTQATAGALSQARKFVDAGGGPAVDLDVGAVRFVALTASTLTISGAAVVVPALQSVPLVAGSSLNTGSGFQEFEA